MYGDVFHSTQGHQHAYECVQPLQGLVTFGEPTAEDHYHNNFSSSGEDRPDAKLEPQKCVSWDGIIFFMLFAKVGIGAALLADIENQTAYNDIYLTYFQPADSTYSVESAGKTNALNCMTIALSLVIFSVTIGLTSSKRYNLSWPASIALVSVLFILQLAAFVLHVVMLIKQNQQFDGNCLTNLSMAVLHALTFVLSLIGLFFLAAAPQSNVKQLTDRIEKAAESRTKHEKNQREHRDNRFRIMKTVTDREKDPIDPSDVSFLNDLTTAVEISDHKADSLLTQEDIYRETSGNFWLCVVEDLNTILCYAFVVRACDAQSSIHDDSTTFFDVLCIVFLGFLQHVANILMIFHAHIDKQTQLQMKAKTDSVKTAMEKQVDELVTFIARTRLLLFFMIGATVFFFYLRVAPTYVQYPMTIPYEICRVFALITMVSLNTLHSVWYEVQNAHYRRKPWDTSPTWKLGALAFIALVFSVLLLYNTTQDKDGDTRHLLHELTPRTTPTPSYTSSPSPANSK